MPYGEKTEEQLIEFADKIFRFFEKKHAKAVVMACNTTSAITYEKLKDNYNFKVYPIIQSVCSTLAKLENVQKLGVIATPATIKSHTYSKEIKKYKLDIIIEDSPETVPTFSKYTKVFLFDARYNKNINGKNITRVYSWYDILKNIEEVV